MRAGGLLDDGLLNCGQLLRTEVGSGLIDLGCSAVRFGDGEVGSHRCCNGYNEVRDVVVVEAEGQAALGSGWHHGAGFDSSPTKDPRDVDPLTGGDLGGTAESVHLTAPQRPSYGRCAVNARVERDGDDHVDSFGFIQRFLGLERTINVGMCDTLVRKHTSTDIYCAGFPERGLA